MLLQGLLLQGSTSVITKFDDYYRTLTPTPSGREPKLTSPDIMGSRIPGTGFQSLSEERGFWIPIVSRTLDSLSGIPESKAQDFRFHKENFSRIPDSTNERFPDSGIRIPLHGATCRSFNERKLLPGGASTAILHWIF